MAVDPSGGSMPRLKLIITKKEDIDNVTDGLLTPKINPGLTSGLMLGSELVGACTHPKSA